MPFWRSTRVLVGIGVVAALAAGGGVAYAATQDKEHGASQATEPVAPHPFLEGVADRLGVTEAELREAFQAEGLERLDEAVASGRLTENRAQRIRERIEEGRPLLRRWARGFHPDLVRAHAVDAAAAYLGLEPDEAAEPAARRRVAPRDCRGAGQDHRGRRGSAARRGARVHPRPRDALTRDNRLGHVLWLSRLTEGVMPGA